MLIARLVRYSKVEKKCKLPFNAVRCYYSTSITSKPPLYNFTHPRQSIHQPNFQNVPKSRRFSSSSFDRQKFAQRRSRAIFAVYLANIWAVAALYSYYLNKVPYTNRWRTLMCLEVDERILVDQMKEHLEEEYKGKILGATHPHSVTVRSILKILINALHRDLGSHDIPRVSYYGAADSVIQPNQKWTFWRTDIISYLKSLNWQVLVLDKPESKTCGGLGGGIIVVPSGLLDCNCDVEITTFIARQVGHSVARHLAESVDYAAGASFLNRIHMSKLVDFNRRVLDFERRAVSEADYIGLRLMASAGYDPHDVLQVYEKLDENMGNDEDEKFAPLPMKERIELLSQPHVMEEACAIYRQTLC